MLALVAIALAFASSASAVPTTPPGKGALPSGWTLHGCVMHDASLAFDLLVSGPNGLTQESCITACAVKGCLWAGIKNDTLCWCGHSQVLATEYPLVNAGERSHEAAFTVQS
jgi:hypothetical protein